MNIWYLVILTQPVTHEMMFHDENLFIKMESAISLIIV